jgi:hypothetical protein
MSRLCVVVLLASALLAPSCSPDRDLVSPDSSTPPPLASAAIGSEGGSLQSEDFVLSVPAGAFSEAADLELYADTAEDSIACNAISARYRVEGVPVDLALPLLVRLRRTEGEAGEDDAVLLGTPGFSSSLGQTLTQWSLTAAEDSSGWIKCAVPAASSSAGKSALRDRPVAVVRTVAAVIDRKHDTPQANFHLWSPLTTLSEAQLAVLGGYLEEAYAGHLQLGFSYNLRTKWPVQVTVRPLPPTVYGYYEASMFGTNSGTLEFNSLHIEDLPELRVTAAHEYLHMVQGFHDPRSAYAQASGGGPQWWLDEATAVWCESRHHSDPAYCPSVRKDNELTPLDGFVSGIHVGDAYFGYGMSSLIRDLVSAQNFYFISATYRRISEGKPPGEALRENMRSPIEGWWDRYLFRLVGGQIYRDVTPKVVEREKKGLFRIASAADTLHTYQTELPDLSGMIYEVRLDYPEIDPASMLKVRVTGGDCTIAAFGMPDTSALVALGEVPTSDSLTVPGLRQLSDQGAKLILLVANSEDEYPANDFPSPITLSLRVVQGIDLSRFYVGYLSLTYHAFWHDGDGDQWDVPEQGLHFFSVPPGQFQGSTYQAVWDSTETSTGMHYSGHFRIVLNSLTLQMESWSVESRWIYPSPGTESIYVCEGGAMTATKLSPTELAYELTGNATCGPLTRVYVKQTSGGQISSEIATWQCNAQSSLTLKLLADSR